MNNLNILTVNTYIANANGALQAQAKLLDGHLTNIFQVSRVELVVHHLQDVSLRKRANEVLLAIYKMNI